MQQATRIVIAWSPASSLCLAGSLFLLLLGSLALAAQQPHHSAGAREPEQSSTPSPNLQQAEELRQQGLFDQARGKVQEELQRNPASVEAYNLLGIIYSDEKDSEQRCRSIPASLETRSRLSKDSQQPGKRLCRLRRSLIWRRRNSAPFCGLTPAIAMRTTTLALADSQGIARRSHCAL